MLEPKGRNLENDQESNAKRCFFTPRPVLNRAKIDQKIDLFSHSFSTSFFDRFLLDLVPPGGPQRRPKSIKNRWKNRCNFEALFKSLSRPTKVDFRSIFDRFCFPRGSPKESEIDPKPSFSETFLIFWRYWCVLCVWLRLFSICLCSLC